MTRKTSRPKEEIQAAAYRKAEAAGSEAEQNALASALDNFAQG